MVKESPKYIIGEEDTVSISGPLKPWEFVLNFIVNSGVILIVEKFFFKLFP